MAGLNRAFSAVQLAGQVPLQRWHPMRLQPLPWRSSCCRTGSRAIHAGIPLAGNTLTAGVLGVVIVLVFSDAGPLHDVGGLVQRLTLLAVFFPCRLLLPARLLRIAGR
jgi:hypothetical protein